MSLLNLSNDTQYIAISFCGNKDITSLTLVNKHISKIARKILKQNIKLLKDIRQKIINIFTQENVKKLNISLILLWNQILPYMNYINKNNIYILANWKNDNNEVIKTFTRSYINHYINNQKTLVYMSQDDSFVTDVTMSLHL